MVTSSWSPSINAPYPNKNLLRPALRFGGEKVALFSDYDGTWYDHRQPPEEARKAKKELEDGIQDLQKEYADKGLDLIFGYVSARPPSRILQENVPESRFTLTHNGGHIYEGLPIGSAPLQDWQDHHAESHFDVQKVSKLAQELIKEKYPHLKLTTIDEVVGNPPEEASQFQVQFCVANDSIKLGPDESPAMFEHKNYQTPKQVLDFFKDIQKRMRQSGMEFTASQFPYPSVRRPYVQFDIAAPDANKGGATDFMIDWLDLKHENVIVAADGGNDLDMMKNDGRKVIIVGANNALRTEVVKKLDAANINMRPVEEVTSLGVLNGLREHLDTIVAGLKSPKESKENEPKSSRLSKFV